MQGGGPQMHATTTAPRRMLVLLLTMALAAILPAATAGAQAGAPISDPIPEEPVTSGLGLTLKEFAQLPRSEPTPAPTDQRLVRWNRINYLGEVPDGSGRLYVPDLNGKLYMLRKGTQRVYLDVGATFAPA